MADLSRLWKDLPPSERERYEQLASTERLAAAAGIELATRNVRETGVVGAHARLRAQIGSFAKTQPQRFVSFCERLDLEECPSPYSPPWRFVWTHFNYDEQQNHANTRVF